MSDVTTALQEALEQEPPLGFGAAEVADRARRIRRRRRAVSLGGTAVAVAVAGAVTGATLATAAPARLPSSAGATTGDHAARLTLMALGRIATGRPKATLSPDEVAARTAVVEGIRGPTLAGLIEQETGLKLTSVQVITLPPTGELDLAAGLVVPGHPSLNVQVTPAGGLTTTTPTCAELSNPSSGNGDGYYGPCRIRKLSDGSLLIVRSGTNGRGGHRMAQATLIRPDGSGVFAEDTNQAWPPAPPPRIPSGSKKNLVTPPIAGRQPVLSADAMAKLVKALAARAAA